MPTDESLKHWRPCRPRMRSDPICLRCFARERFDGGNALEIVLKRCIEATDLIAHWRISVGSLSGT